MSEVAIQTTNPLEILYQPDSPISETVLGYIIGASTDIYADTRGSNKTAQDLADLHRLIRSCCSDRFRELSDADPNATREDLNADPQLMALNSVRRTLHQAMVNRQNNSTNKFRIRSKLWEKL